MRVRTQLTTRGKAATLLALAALALTACGTRLPSQDFSLTQVGASPGASQGPTGVGPSTGTTNTQTNGNQNLQSTAGTNGTKGHTTTSGGPGGGVTRTAKA